MFKKFKKACFHQFAKQWRQGFTFLAVFVLLMIFALPVFALELNYPNLPGVGHLEAEKPLSFYATYFLNLFFYITAGICVLIIMYAGVLYVSGGQKTTTIIKAREYLKRGLLGLFILLISYTILYAINPDLTIFRVDKKDLPPSGAIAGAPYDKNQIVVQEVPTLTLSKAILEGLGFKVYRDDDGNFIDEHGFLTDGYGNYIDKAGNYLGEGDDKIQTVWWGVDLTNFIYRAQIPFIEIGEAIAEAVDIIEGIKDNTGAVIKVGLKELLSDCKCGLSDHYVEWNIWNATGENGGAECVGGLDPADTLLCQEPMLAKGESTRTGKNICKVRCGGEEPLKCGENFCGDQTFTTGSLAGFPMCDTRQVKKTRTTVTDSYGNERQVDVIEVEVKQGEWKYLTGRTYWEPVLWEPSLAWALPTSGLTAFDVDGSERALIALTGATDVRPERLIRHKILRLVELQAELDSQKQRFFPEQLGFVAKSLSVNKIAFSMSETEGGIFNHNFLDFKKEKEDLGFDVVVKPFLSASKDTTPLSKNDKPGLWDSVLAMLAPSAEALTTGMQFADYEAGTLFFIVFGDETVQDPKITERNQFVAAEAARFSLFSVLTNLSIEKIKEMFEACLSAAFGAANYYLDEGELTAVIQQSIDQGAAAHFEAVLNSKLDEMSRAAEQGIEDAINKDVDIRFIRKYVKECRGDARHPCSDLSNAEVEDDDVILEIIQKLKEGCDPLSACCPCVRDYISQGIPPHFVSNLVSMFFTTRLIDVFPKIGETLNAEMRKILFKQGGTIDQWLNKETLELYDAILRNAITSSFAEMQDGFIQGILDKEMKKILPELVVDQLTKIDMFLECTIEGCCKTKAVEKQARFINGIGGCCVDYDCWEQYTDDHYCISGDDSHSCDPSAPSGTCFLQETFDVEKKIVSEDDCKGNEKFQIKNGEPMCCIEGMKKWIKRHSEDYVRGLVRQYVEEPFSKWMKSKISGLGVENASVKECFGELYDARIFEFGGSIPDPTLKHFEGIAVIPDWKEMPPTTLHAAPIVNTGLDRRTTSPGICKKWTPEEINNLLSTILVPEFEFIDIGGPGVVHTGVEMDAEGFGDRYVAFQSLFLDGTPSQRVAICNKSGYAWSCSLKGSKDEDAFMGFKRSDDCACVESNDITQDMAGAADAARNIGKTTKNFFINYTEQMGIAIIETMLHTAVEYAKVFIEDSIIAPFRSSFDKVVNFQHSLRNFLNGSLEDALPDEITGILHGSIDDQIKAVCDAYKNGTIVPGTCEPDEPEVCDMGTTVGFKLPDGVSWDNSPVIGEDIVIHKETGDFFCGLTEHLHSSIFDELSRNTDIKNLLERSILSHLESGFCGVDEFGARENCIADFLNQTPIQLMWPGLRNIEDLVKGTPKQLLCGEIAFDVDGWGTDGVPVKPIDKCSAIRSDKLGILPAINIESPVFQAFSQDEAGKYVPWCYFIWTACQKPSGLGGTVGDLVERLATATCNFVDEKITKTGSSDCKSLDPEELTTETSDTDSVQDLPDNLKYSCRGCQNIVNNPTAEGLFYWSVREDIGPVSVRTELEAEIEKDIYQWLLVYFPRLKSNIRNVAEKRGIAPGSLEEVDNLPDRDFEHLLMALIDWRLNRGGTLESLITAIPLYVIKPLTAGEDTLLVEESHERVNFLDKKPYELLNNYFCQRIETDFAEQYPAFTLEALTDKAWQKAGEALPYSIESVQTHSIAKRLEIINDLDIDEGLKDGYLLCKSLNLTPAQIFGLDQHLKNYIRPKEFIILFDLIYNNLDLIVPKNNMPVKGFRQEGFNEQCCGQDTSECYILVEHMPKKLIDMLCHLSVIPEDLVKVFYYIYEAYPKDILLWLADDAKNKADEYRVRADEANERELRELEADLRAFVEFLDTTIGQQMLKVKVMNDRIFDTIFPEGLGGFEDIDFADVQDDLKKTPLVLIKEHLIQPLGPDGLPDKSLMDLLSKDSVLDQPYLDTLGRWSGLDEVLFGAAEAENKLKAWIEQGVEKSLSVIQESLETAILQWPRDMANAVARLLGFGIGDKVGDQIAGDCRAVNNDKSLISGEDDCKQGEIFRRTAGRNECCNLGFGVVCESRCIPIPERGCDELLGQEQEEINEAQHCCYKQIERDGETLCRKCRVINADAGGKCRKDEDGRDIEELDEIKGYSVCCRLEPCNEYDDECCTTVMECVMNKFADHLEALAEMLADGEVPLSDLRFRE